ncbi:MAG: hypothetical protein IT183_06090 [Acidobacteria bacterium]|nr:hypothetical protein [Acidobacteriota bacterium]
MSKTLGLTATLCAALLLSSAALLTARDVDRQGAGDEAVDALKTRAEQRRNDPESWYKLAKHYSDRVQNDAKLARDVSTSYVLLGLEADERALSINPVYYEALRLKNVLLRQRARHEPNAAVQKRLLADAIAATAKADELARKYNLEPRRGR